jgi:ATP-dependent RNA helicase RhlE
MMSAPRDGKNLDAIEKLLQTEIPRLENPVAPSKEPVAQAPVENVEQKQVQAEPKPQSRERYGRQRNKQNKHNNENKQSNAKKDHKNVVGMGPDLPSFIALSFQERMVQP